LRCLENVIRRKVFTDSISPDSPFDGNRNLRFVTIVNELILNVIDKFQILGIYSNDNFTISRTNRYLVEFPIHEVTHRISHKEIPSLVKYFQSIDSISGKKKLKK
jgi:hypothetical protein